MKEKHKNGCNILIMTFTNLEKYVYSKKGLKQRRQPPTLPPAKSQVFSRRYFLTAAKRSRSNRAWKKVGYRCSFWLPQLFHFLEEKALSGKSK